MKRRLLSYIEYVSKELEKDDINVEDFKKELLLQIQFFQHERLVHLIVTITFALLLMMTFGIFMVTEMISVMVLAVLLLVLLVPYIKHYYLLENGVQKLYTLYDKLVGNNFLK